MNILNFFCFNMSCQSNDKESSLHLGWKKANLQIHAYGMDARVIKFGLESGPVHLLHFPHEWMQNSRHSNRHVEDVYRIHVPRVPVTVLLRATLFHKKKKKKRRMKKRVGKRNEKLKR